MSAGGTPMDSKWSQLAPLSGVLFTVLYLIGSLLIAAFDYLPEPSQVVDFFTDDALRIQTGGYVATVSVFFLLWFPGSLGAFLSTADGRNGRLAIVAFGGGVASSSTVLISSVIMLAAAARAGSDGGIGSEAATLAYDLYGGIVGSLALLPLLLSGAAPCLGGWGGPVSQLLSDS